MKEFTGIEVATHGALVELPDLVMAYADGALQFELISQLAVAV